MEELDGLIININNKCKLQLSGYVRVRLFSMMKCQGMSGYVRVE